MPVPLEREGLYGVHLGFGVHCGLHVIGMGSKAQPCNPRGRHGLLVLIHYVEVEFNHRTRVVLKQRSFLPSLFHNIRLPFKNGGFRG